MNAITLPAYAKLNLYLEMLGRRPDGFHELETVFQTIDLHDEVRVTVEPGEGITLHCDDATLPCDATNLAWRAAAAYRAANPVSGRISLGLVKRIPAGAGLGGGSADAAAVLVACDQLSANPLGPARLETLAATLGSDISFLVRGGTAHATGRGEVLSALPDAPPLALTLLMPDGAHCATPAVYKALTDAERCPRPALGRDWFAARITDPTAWLHNRLSAPARRVCPAVGDLLDHLAGCGVPYLMTGSGAACFAFGTVSPPPGVRSWPCRLAPARPVPGN
ncbi:MAG TPA: 4-(cytidine 5'-diphospho)-2-C-methyl-D-erythritol kinase [Planctomycetes bacterium]|nr:4-(cytidine 5'-diphospho)-2-C-methyl-D-erythritol kinase [Planctomycetota bacterium]